LFTYCSGDGQWRSLTSNDVNRYLKQVAGRPFTAKDFRTWRGTAIAAGLLRRSLQKGRIRKRTINETVKKTAAALGNTATVCRKFYVNPEILEAFESPAIADCVLSFRPRNRSLLDDDEQFLLCLLDRCDRKARARRSPE
jgi:DNA topoisomerase-1